MKVKIEIGSPLYSKLIQLQEDMQAAKDVACELFNSVIITIDRPDATEWHQSGMVLTGGISAFVLKGGKPTNWKNAFIPHEKDCYMPANRTVNKELIKKIDHLPKIHYKSLNSLIGYKSIWGHPGFAFLDNMVLLDCPTKNMPDTLPDGAIEILESEYYKLIGK